MALDSLTAHRGERVRRVIEARGVGVWFLPAYSPGLTPIKEAFSKHKALLRRAEARCQEALVGAIRAALRAITSQDARGRYAHCRYPLPAQDS